MDVANVEGLQAPKVDVGCEQGGSAWGDTRSRDVESLYGMGAWFDAGGENLGAEVPSIGRDEDPAIGWRGPDHLGPP